MTTTLPDVEIDGSKLKAARKAAGFSQAEAARRVGLTSRQQVWNYENGQGEPSASTLVRLCLLYGVQAESLAR